MRIPTRPSTTEARRNTETTEKCFKSSSLCTLCSLCASVVNASCEEIEIHMVATQLEPDGPWLLEDAELEQLRLRALRIKLVLTDCDGVLTDGGVYYSGNGEELKRFSVRDGMGVQRLREAGIETAIITREQSPSIKKRAEKLKLRYLYLGVGDKFAHLAVVKDQTGLRLDQLAYIGDDVNDLDIIQAIDEQGLTGAPMDAMPEVRGAVHYCCVARGGHGAFRDFSEWILRLRE